MKISLSRLETYHNFYFLHVVSTLAEAVDKALETRNFNNVYELIEVPEIDAS